MTPETRGRWPVQRLLFACGLGLLLGGRALAAPRYSIVCGSSASICSTSDTLKINVTLDPGAAAGAAEAQWADGKTRVVITERNDPSRSLPEPLMRLQETGTAGQRQIDLHSVVDPTSLHDEQLLSMLYRKPAPTLQLQVSIQRDGQADTVLPFVLDLTPAYKDASVDLLFGQSGAPYCVTPDNQPTPCRLGAVLVLPFENLEQWEAGSAHPSFRPTLYLNDVPMNGLTSARGAVLASTGAPYSLRYPLTRDLSVPDKARMWQNFLSTASGSPLVATIGVGVDARTWVFPPGQSVSIELPRHAPIPWIIGFAVLVLVWALGRLTATLRAYPAVPMSQRAFDLLSADQKTSLARVGVTSATFTPPHSLSMLFMALWIAVVTLSFGILWYLTRSGDLINTTALALMGIGATSMVCSRAIDTPSPEDQAADQQLAAAIAASSPVATDPQTAVKNAVNTALVARLITSGHWVSDLLSERGSARIDLHRLQLTAFTLFYLIIFLASLNTLLALPEFSSNTLALLGISNAGYLGFKFASQ